MRFKGFRGLCRAMNEVPRDNDWAEEVLGEMREICRDISGFCGGFRHC